MIFRNGRIIFPDGVRNDVEVVVADGRIAAIRAAGSQGRGEIVDLGGNYLAPGFVDLHVHGAVGRDAMEGSSDAFRAICQYHATGGTTSLLLTTATASISEIQAVLAAARTAARDMPQIAGVHVEGPFISAERAGAQRSEFIRDPDAESVTELLEFSDVIKRLTLAPEVPGACALIDQLRNRNISVSGGHSDAWDEEARAAFERGMRSVTHTFNCMSSARRRGGRRVAGLLEFALSEPEISCELIADGHHVSTTLMRMLYRAKGADGICLVTDATAGAGLPSGSEFMLAGTNCVTEDGGCFLAGSSTLAGSAARMVDVVRTMIEAVGVPVHEAIRMATANPARALGSTQTGTISVGAEADLVVLSPALEVVQVFKGGARLV